MNPCTRAIGFILIGGHEFAVTVSPAPSQALPPGAGGAGDHAPVERAVATR